MTRIVAAASVVGFFVSLLFVFALAFYARALREALADCQRGSAVSGQSMTFPTSRRSRAAHLAQGTEDICGLPVRHHISNPVDVRHG